MPDSRVAKPGHDVRTERLHKVIDWGRRHKCSNWRGGHTYIVMVSPRVESKTRPSEP